MTLPLRCGQIVWAEAEPSKQAEDETAQALIANDNIDCISFFLVLAPLPP
jgi:hypothetical protein